MRGKNLKEKILLKWGYQIKMFFSSEVQKTVAKVGEGSLRFF
jgi:hypothetical protein